MKLQIFDSKGVELKIGDKVKIQSKRYANLTFYATVQVINGQLFPFKTFSFDRITKVDQIPPDCRYKPCSVSDNAPEYWMHPNQK